MRGGGRVSPSLQHDYQEEATHIVVRNIKQTPHPAIQILDWGGCLLWWQPTLETLERFEAWLERTMGELANGK